MNCDSRHATAPPIVSRRHYRDESMARFLQHLYHPSSAKAARIASLLIIPASVLAALGWQASEFAKAVEQQTSMVANSSPSPSVSPPEKKSLDRSLLALFGSADNGNLGQLSSEPLPESNLDLQISAIFFVTPPENSSIIIEDGNKTLILKPGDEARPGIVVSRIESSRVTFKRNGKLEQLSFRGFGDGEADQSSLPTAATESTSAQPAEMSQAAIQGEQIQPTAYQQFIQRKLAQNK